MDAVDRMLAALEQEAQSFSAFEMDEFEDSFEETFNPRQRSAFNRIRAKSGLRRATPRGASRNQSTMGLRNIQGSPQGIKAQFDIIVKYTPGTSSVAGTIVEFILFGAGQLDSGYYQCFEGTRPTSVAWGGNGAYTNAQQVKITHAGNLGVVDISCATMDYPSFLRTLLVDNMRISRLRASITDTSANGLLTLNQTIKIQNRSLFGKEEKNSISMGSYKVPEQNQTSIIDIPLSAEISKDIFISGKIVSPAVYASAVVTQTLTLSFFVEMFNKH